ncbi:MAG: hypothetical protein RR448_00590 [Niameybacter sp.]|uniref:hypothetical protein n=1 Tax=Niameybacter sp. TaxID=2033640 RepID=UPI002FCB8378
MSAVHCSKEDTFFEHLCIPSHKPPILKLVKCEIIPEVSEYKLVDTLHGRSFEGEILTGINLIVLLTLNEEMTYISDTVAQTIHAIHYTFLKTIILNVPELPDPATIKQLIQTGHFTLTPSITSTHTHIKSPTYFDQNVLLSLDFHAH